MKKLLILSAFLLFTHSVNSQWIIESFDSSAGIFFKGSYPPLSLLFHNDTTHIEGTGSLRINYYIEASEVWGGYGSSSTYTPGDTALQRIDLSGGEFLSFRYKILQPVNMTSPGQLSLEFKLAEMDEYGNRDLWYHYTSLDFTDSTAQWIQLNMPLVVNSNNTLGFALQFGDGDGLLQLENIRGFEIGFAYSTTGGNPAPNASGSLLMDRLELLYPSSSGENVYIPSGFKLEQNFPNPFNPGTVIRYSIDKPQFIQLAVYDVIGNKVAELVCEYKEAGIYNVNFNPSKLASGIYIYTLRAGEFSQTRKMIYIK